MHTNAWAQVRSLFLFRLLLRRSGVGPLSPSVRVHHAAAADGRVLRLVVPAGRPELRGLSRLAERHLEHQSMISAIERIDRMKNVLCRRIKTNKHTQH